MDFTVQNFTVQDPGRICGFLLHARWRWIHADDLGLIRGSRCLVIGGGFMLVKDPISVLSALLGLSLATLAEEEEESC